MAKFFVLLIGKKICGLYFHFCGHDFYYRITKLKLKFSILIIASLLSIVTLKNNGLDIRLDQSCSFTYVAVAIDLLSKAFM